MKTFSYLLALVAISIFAVGCDNSTTDKSGTTEGQGEGDGHNHDEEGHDDHDHAAHDHSPRHGGHLIELGRNHEYHAELVDDHQTESVTIYLMDSHMEPLSINESSISLTLTAGDDTRAFELIASQPGGSPEFASNDGQLMEMIEGEEVKGKLRVMIDGKPFTGTFDHHGHGHEGGDDDHSGHKH